MYYPSPENTSQALKMDWLIHAFAISSTGLGKIAFAVFLLRIIPKNEKWKRWFLHGYNALLVAINIPLIIITYVQCDPVVGLWEPTIGAKCWPPHIQANYAVFQGCISPTTQNISRTLLILFQHMERLSILSSRCSLYPLYGNCTLIGELSGAWPPSCALGCCTYS